MWVARAVAPSEVVGLVKAGLVGRWPIAVPCTEETS
jgi:hypothetical protein